LQNAKLITNHFFFSFSDGTKTRLIPRLTVVTPKLPEEGSVTCNEPGEYVLEFTNNSNSWFNNKLEYIVDLEEAN
jgi:hypothetical protein